MLFETGFHQRQYREILGPIDNCEQLCLRFNGKEEKERRLICGAISKLHRIKEREKSTHVQESVAEREIKTLSRVCEKNEKPGTSVSL